MLRENQIILAWKKRARRDADVRIFGKPTMRPKRRMGVVLVSGELDANLDEVRSKAKRLADYVQVVRQTD